MLRSYFFPGRLYRLATLDALSATALNSAPVQALEVVTSEMAPAAAVARNAAIADSASLVSHDEQKVGVASREVEVYKFATSISFRTIGFSVLRRSNQSLGIVPGESPTCNQSDHGYLSFRFVIIATGIIIIWPRPLIARLKPKHCPRCHCLLSGRAAKQATSTHQPERTSCYNAMSRLAGLSQRLILRVISVTIKKT